MAAQPSLFYVRIKFYVPEYFRDSHEKLAVSPLKFYSSKRIDRVCRMSLLNEREMIIESIRFEDYSNFDNQRMQRFVAKNEITKLEINEINKRWKVILIEFWSGQPWKDGSREGFC